MGLNRTAPDRRKAAEGGMMRNLKSALLIGTLAGAVFAISPAAATTLGSALGKGISAPATDSMVIEVQSGKKKGGSGKKAGGGGGGGGGGGNRNRNIGAGIAAGVAVGIIGAAIAADQARRSESIEYCMDRYPNYDPRRQTWWDRYGRPHRCPR
jgi:hypothetical protein